MIVRPPRTIENLYWYFPVIQIPRWQAIIRVFQPWLWILVTITFLFGTLTFWLITKFQNPNEVSVILVLMNTLLSFTGNGMSYKFKGAVYLLLFLLWEFFCLQISTVYQSNLLGYLIYPGEYKHIVSEEELNISKLEKYSTVMYTSAHIASATTPYPMMNLTKAVKEMYEKRNMAIIASKNLLDIAMPHYYTEVGKPQLVKISKPVETMYMSIFYKLPCIISRHINNRIKQFYYNGIFESHSQSVYRRYLREYAFPRNVQSIVSLSNFQSVFYLLIVGLLLSLIAFCFEVLYHYYKFHVFNLW